MASKRPNPEKLLELAAAEEAAKGRGRLKIYLGMAAGVGKTYAMLHDALSEIPRGRRIVAGYIEPHGRPETETLSKQLPHIPMRVVEYRGLSLGEMDLDRCLAERPAVLLVDELAHTNAPGSRHLKRYQDVEELLSHGMNVWTTVNVQHIESLKDVVGQITGVDVQETVPDSFIARADEIELVDIPPDELIQRLEMGKIYAAEKVNSALRNFFQKGNLIALREIVLRHAADTVDAQLRRLRTSEGVRDVWATAPRVLVSIAPNRFAPRLVRAAARLARNLRAPFVVLTVETPRTQAASEQDRGYVERALSLGERLGGEIVRTSGHDIVSEILRVARETNSTILMAGKPRRGWWYNFIHGSVVDDLLHRSEELDVYFIQGSRDDGTVLPIIPKGSKTSFRSLTESLLAVTGATAICFAMYPAFELSNLIMVYLLAVTWVASRHGKAEAITASLVSVLIFDVCFVPPRWTLAVTDAEYLVTFLVMLVVALLISTLTLRLRSQVKATGEREERTAMFLGFSKSLASCRSLEGAADIARETILKQLRMESAVFWPRADKRAISLNRSPLIEQQGVEEGVVKWVAERKSRAGVGTETLPGSKGYYLPLETRGERAAVLGIFPGESALSGQAIELVEGMSHLLTIALNRIVFESEATTAQVRAEREELKNILLSSVSHDLRTPLTTITGAAAMLATESGLSERASQLATTITESSGRLALIVRNVLDLSRLESGALTMNREWHSLEEIIGVALEQTESLLGSRKVTLRIPAQFPLMNVDGLLLEQLFVNLLENLARHTPETTSAEISADHFPEEIVIRVADNGPGLEVGSEVQIFDKLYRGKLSHGFGLGLAICKAIAVAHDGSIAAENLPQGGACFTIRLRVDGNPPEVPTNDE